MSARDRHAAPNGRSPHQTVVTVPSAEGYAARAGARVRIAGAARLPLPSAQRGQRVLGLLSAARAL